MSYPNTAPITGGEKGWGLVLAILSFPLGLIALIGLLADQSWARWVGLVLSVLVALVGVGVVVWLLVSFIPEQGSSYPFAPWFVFLAGLAAVLGLLAARRFRAGLQSTGTE